MGQADERLAAGDLDGARLLLVERIRSAPEDQAARMFLFQLLAVCGEWDKAATQLRALAQLDPETRMLSLVYGQLIAAEKERAEVHTGRRPAPVLVESSPWVAQWAAELNAAAVGVGAGDGADAAPDRRSDLLEAAPDTPGAWNGEAFGWIMDADDRFGPTLELMIDGAWGLVPFEAVQQVSSKGPRDLRDLVWLPVEVTLRSGQTASGFLPVRYPGSETAADPRARLARVTDWVDGPAGAAGVGQRMFVGDEGQAFDLLSLRLLKLA